MKKLLLLLLIPFSVKAYTSSATSTVLMDMDSNRVIYENNAHSVRSVASISKIMTAIIAIENKDIKEKIIVDDIIKEAYGSGIYIKENEELTLEDLLYGLMLRSGNDASLVIAKNVGGTVENFVNLMNEKAKELGMNNTIFNNPNGLDEEKGNLSTAYDMALLTSYAMKNETYKKIVSTKKYTVKTNMNYYVWINKHKLLHAYPYITGGKTGYTKIAKRTLVTTSSKDNINLVAVTLNDGNDFIDHINLFKEAFKKYTNYNILKKGYLELLNEDYYKNDTLYIKNNYNISLENNNHKVLLKYKLNKKEYKSEDNVGVIEVYIDEKLVHEENIYVKKNIKISKKEKIIRWFKNLW